MEILAVKDLKFTYPLCDSPAVDGLSFSIGKGDFTVVCGATGSGKSTLLRLLKPALAPNGDRSGGIFYKGVSMEALSPGEAASSIGFVMQNPEQQIVTDKVWHELAFGLENLNMDVETIARRVAEMASYFGIEGWYEKRVTELSGGQKQLLNLASVMVMDPDILILDEPTAQLDPIAASNFIATLKKLNRDFSLTVIIVEHRLEELIPLCDRLLVLENGRLLHSGAPREVIKALGQKEALLCAMPSAARLYHALSLSCPIPLDAKEGREMIETNFDNRIRSLPRQKYSPGREIALSFEEVCFRYGRNQPDVLKALNLRVYENEIFCILGGNGSGKSTTLGVASGLLRAYSGSVRVFGKKLKEYKNQALYRECLSLLPQDVQTVFLKNTVREELEGVGAELADFPFDLSHLSEKHPYDLSGGEQQLVALAKVLSTKPRLLLMDEPTKGLDAEKKQVFAEILKQLKGKGITVVMVSHDVEFAASCADRCALFFRGQIVSADIPEVFFSENRFYTTVASRMTKGFFEGAVTLESVAALCRLNDKRGETKA